MGIMDRTSEKRDIDLDATNRGEKDELSSNGHSSSPPAYRNDQDGQTGEVYDPYGGKKLGMIRVRIMCDKFTDFMLMYL